MDKDQYDFKLEILRRKVDKCDKSIYKNLVDRLGYTKEIGLLKKEYGVDEMSEKRKEEIIEKLTKWCVEDGFPSSTIIELYDVIFKTSIVTQLIIIHEK